MSRRRESEPRVLLLFLDGVGIGPSDPDVNPFFAARLPVLADLLGGRLPSLDEPVVEGPGAHAFPLAATLGVEGTPQSGTGQTALLTGESAAELYGRHFGPWTPVRLRPLVEQGSVLRRLVDADRAVAFANAYPRGWPGERGERRLAAPPLAARGAGLLVRHAEALARGEAVASEIVNESWRRYLGHTSLPEVSPRQAGANLAAIACAHELTLYAHYATDTAGHRGRMPGAVSALERVDAFLGGLLERISGVTVVIASDHGNIEDVRAGHTRNPALGVTIGPRAAEAARERDIRAITPFILGLFGLRRG